MKYEVWGLANPRDYAGYNGDCPYQQLVVEGEYEVLKPDPDIRTVNRIDVKPKVKKCQLIRHSPRPKVLIYGELEFAYLYSIRGEEESVHSGVCKKEFQGIVELLPGYDPMEIEEENLYPHILVENLTMSLVHCRKFRIFGLLFIYLQMR